MTPEKRIGVLDVLRGIALFGMFLVHFKDFSSGGGGIDAFYTKIVELFFEERFWAMFGILFGVSFAIQFRRAEATFAIARRIAGAAETAAPQGTAERPSDRTAQRAAEATGLHGRHREQGRRGGEKCSANRLHDRLPM